MNYRISICILLCLAILASGQAAAQPTFGTKVQAGDPDIGLPLSGFNPTISPTPTPGVTSQATAYLSFWDVGATPGLFDNQDVIYLQFGSITGTPSRIVRANNIRMTGWGNYPAGSIVTPGDADIGQQLLPWIPATFPAIPGPSFAYMEVDGELGYGLGDPVYIDLNGAPPVTTGTNDVRLTSFAGFPAGSRVSNADPDAVRPLLAFYAAPLLPTPTAGPAPTGAVAPIGRLSFYNANGNIAPTGAPNNGIYDDGDVAYFDVAPLGVVSVNDIRLF